MKTEAVSNQDSAFRGVASHFGSFGSRLPTPTSEERACWGTPASPLTHDDRLMRGDFAPRGFIAETYANLGYPWGDRR
ncbi:MAG: hypothetical protein WCG81_04080 [Candidatus Angelobacter sp.]